VEEEHGKNSKHNQQEDDSGNARSARFAGWSIIRPDWFWLVLCRG